MYQDWMKKIPEMISPTNDQVVYIGGLNYVIEKHNELLKAVKQLDNKLNKLESED